MSTIMTMRIVCTALVLLLFYMMYLTAYALRNTGRKGIIAASAVILLLVFAYLQICMASLRTNIDEEYSSLRPIPGFDEIPGIILYSVFVILVIIVIILGDLIYGWNEIHITPYSVKEALDILPDGLLYYNEDGIIKFMNPAMRKITFSLTGALMLNGEDIFEVIKDGMLREGVRIESGEKPVIRLTDGRVLSFERHKKILDGKPIFEVICFDNTALYDLRERLTENKNRLSEQKERLTTLGRSITEMIIEREMLDAKVRIHDDLGKGLTATRYFIEQGKGTKEEIIELWKTNLRLLENAEKPRVRDEYETVFKASGDVGVSISLKGSLPVEEENKRVIAAAIRESVTNTFRHAKGNTVYIDSMADKTEYTVVIRNDGEAPKGKIVEKGGLLNLRKLVERTGGSMEIKSSPQYELRIKLFRMG